MSEMGGLQVIYLAYVWRYHSCCELISIHETKAGAYWAVRKVIKERIIEDEILWRGTKRVDYDLPLGWKVETRTVSK